MCGWTKITQTGNHYIVVAVLSWSIACKGMKTTVLVVKWKLLLMDNPRLVVHSLGLSINRSFYFTTSVQAGAVLMPLAMFLLSLKSIRVLY